MLVCTAWRSHSFSLPLVLRAVVRWLNVFNVEWRDDLRSHSSIQDRGWSAIATALANAIARLLMG
ncbi:MAG: hypothetical protein AB1861_04810 [Cyanobacteriota bacterium]